MPNIYRVRYKKGDVELDIESSDKDYVDGKLGEILKLEAEVPAQEVANGRRGHRHGERGTSQKSQVASDGGGRVTESVLAEIIASINDAENYEDLGKYVLDKADRTARILMCYYFAHKHGGDAALTSTHIERITAQLGVKIAAANVAKVIRESASQYLAGDRVRKQGFAVHYKINRRGIAVFEKMIKGEKQ
jgi:hypothetical protein